MTAAICLAVAAAGCRATPGSQPDMDVVVHDVPTVALIAIDGDSLNGADGTAYRLLGINAPDAPECLAEDSAMRLKRLVADPVSVVGEDEDQFGRRLVYVFRPEGSPSWVNLALVRQGLAIAIHADGVDKMLFDAQDKAREDKVGLWDPSACGDGPLEAIEIVDIEPNPPGPDDQSLAEEWIAVANRGPDPVDLTGWTIRDESTQNRYAFPAGFVLGPGEEQVITSGDGEFGFDLGTPIWNNGGDTALVVDDQGRFVSFLSAPRE